MPPKVPTGRSQAMQAQCNMMQQKCNRIFKHNEKALPKHNIAFSIDEEITEE